MKRFEIFLIISILALGFTARLYRFDNPIADWHSWRQADTSAVSRNFIKYGFDILHPRFDDLSNVPSGKDNPNGYRFVEFPIYNLAQAGFFKTLGLFTLEQWGRLVSIFVSLLSSVFIYLLVKKYATNLAAFFAALFFTFLPFNIYFSRTILPDTMMVMAILGGTYFFDLAIEKEFRISNFEFRIKQWLYYILAIIFTASSFLLKPYALFFTLPIIYLSLKTFGLKLFLKWQIWVFTILTLAPLIFWRVWMQQFPEGIPVSAWLFNEGNIRFKGAFFHWIFADRIGRLILGYWGLPLFILGLISLGSKTKGKALSINGSGVFLSFLLSSLLYIFVIARGNVQHDYYQILIIPAITIFLGLGAEFLIISSKEYLSKTINYTLFAICFFLMFFLGWYNIRDFFNINNPSIIIAGKAVDKLIPKKAKIITLYNGDTSFLYQTNRQGWSSFEKSLPEMIKLGAAYLVLVNPTEKDFQGLGKTYQILSATKDYIILDLSKKL